jgi:hypothetical protein
MDAMDSAERLAAVLDAIRNELPKLYGDRLKGVYLRPRECVDDIPVADLVIVLDEVTDLLTELKRMAPLTTRLEIKYGVVVDHAVLPMADWRDTARRRGIDDSVLLPV